MSSPRSKSSGSPEADAPVQPGRLSIDRDGNWRHEGVVITHPGTVALFFRGLEPDGEGGYRVRVGDEVSPVDVEDTPLLVRSVNTSADPPALRLSDGTDDPLDPATLRQAGDNAFYCRVKDGRFPARFTRPAYYLLAERIDLDDRGEYVLKTGGRSIRLDLSRSGS